MTYIHINAKQVKNKKCFHKLNGCINFKEILSLCIMAKTTSAHITLCNGFVFGKVCEQEREKNATGLRFTQCIV